MHREERNKKCQHQIGKLMAYHGVKGDPGSLQGMRRRCDGPPRAVFLKSYFRFSPTVVGVGTLGRCLECGNRRWCGCDIRREDHPWGRQSVEVVAAEEGRCAGPLLVGEALDPGFDESDSGVEMSR